MQDRPPTSTSQYRFFPRTGSLVTSLAALTGCHEPLPALYSTPNRSPPRVSVRQLQLGGRIRSIHVGIPIRRHRSVTLSLARYGERICRDDRSASSRKPTHHPYAVSSHSGSAQSSPGTYNVPLDYNASITSTLLSHLSRSNSTSQPGSSHLPDQMNQVLHLDSVDTGYTGESTTTAGGSYGGIY